LQHRLKLKTISCDIEHAKDRLTNLINCYLLFNDGQSTNSLSFEKVASSGDVILQTIIGLVKERNELMSTVE
jgi:hypothetical protein